MSVEASNLSICKHHKPRWEINGVFFALNQTIQSTGKVRTNSMEKIYSIDVNIAWICGLLSLKCSFKYDIISSYKTK